MQTNTRRPIRRDRDHSSFSGVGLLSVVLILGSSLQGLPINLGSAHLYPAQILALALFPLFFSSNPYTSAVKGSVLWSLGLSIIFVAPSLLLASRDPRIFFVLQMIVNGVTLVVSFELFQKLQRRELRTVVGVVALIMVSISLAQILGVLPGGATWKTTFGYPHPVLNFSEDTWLALFLALLASAALSLGATRSAVFLGLMVVFIGTRAAIVIVVVALLMASAALASRRWVRVLAVTAPLAIAIWFVNYFVRGSGDRLFHDTVDTRAQDIYAVRQANGESFFPFGGDVFEIYDSARTRVIPQTSNVQAFELIWKFGAGGILILILFSALVALILPRLVAPEWRPREIWPAWLALSVLVPMMQFNSAFGFSWLWIMIALNLASIASTRELPDIRASDVSRAYYRDTRGGRVLGGTHPDHEKGAL